MPAERKTRKKVLIANRGEIALRIIRAARENGFSPVAVFSEADRGAVHVRLADEAYALGPAEPSQSYLNIPKLIAVAKKCKAWGIHPGYGFLSENAEFARAVEKAGFVFIGPTSQTIAKMGDKIEARKIAEKAGLPLVPALSPVDSVEQAQKAAREIGYPVLLKARAGGGGKGMRRIDRDKELPEGFEMARSEALKAFGDQTVYMERFVEKPRHIEVQIFADHSGNVLALSNRECSIQRRHQKIIEEAPAPHLSEKTREKMAQAACRLAKAVKYIGAGTVEFLVDRKERFYFLEMNTRLQVEHPVTESVLGYDLVDWQLDVAQKKRLPITQRQVNTRGHSIEVRLYAEDPENHFYPSPGKIEKLQWPSGPGIRVDSGVEIGTDVTTFYDPLLAKIVVWGATREVAVRRMKRALGEVRVSGLKTNLTFLQGIIADPVFEKGKLTTAFLDDNGPFIDHTVSALEMDAAIAVAALTIKEKGSRIQRSKSNSLESPWWASGLPQAPVFPKGFSK